MNKIQSGQIVQIRELDIIYTDGSNMICRIPLTEYEVEAIRLNNDECAIVTIRGILNNFLAYERIEKGHGIGKNSR